MIIRYNCIFGEKKKNFSSIYRTSFEHARRHRSYFHCHAKVRAYARCGAIRQSVGHNRADSRHGTKYANSTDVGNGPTKTINATDCMCSYIDGSIKISASSPMGGKGREEWLRFPSNPREIPSSHQFSRNISCCSNIERF